MNISDITDKLIYFYNNNEFICKKEWTEYENTRLNKLFNIKKMNILKISYKLKRKPKIIINKLKKLNYVSENSEVFGYDDYIKSAFYKIIVNNIKNKSYLIDTNNDSDINLNEKLFEMYNNNELKTLYDNQDDELIKLYNNNKLNIINISVKLNTMPHIILKKLKLLGYINNTSDVRGYKEYTNSKYYKSRVNENMLKYKNQSMNIDDIEINFDNAGEPWSLNEDNKLKKLYIEKELNLLDIIKEHKRSAGSICARLVRLKIISNRKNARGYDRNLFKLLNNQQKDDFINKSINNTNDKQINNLITFESNKTIQNKIDSLTNEVNEMKLSIKKLLQLVNKQNYENNNLKHST
tara:strand:- start:491 stop:1546 length:1056 start_codon:yes stop_codon:yes gene_type:complete